MNLPADLAAMQERIEGYARDYGLSFAQICYEMVDYRMVNQLAAYGGFPLRYPHWRFGMEYERLSRSYAYGLHRIYEMVINTEPVVAYLLASNNFVDQKLVMAHVCGHADFFKNNLWFAHTNRRMLDEMANHATRINRYVSKYGMDAVEDFLDACLSLENLIDPHAAGIRRRPEPVSDFDEEEEEAVVHKIPAKHYMDSYINPPEFLAEEQRKLEDAKERRKHFPEEPERDILLFLLEHAPLENWQRDVLDIVREEAYYFAPQGQTKIMNEGWACLVAGSLVYTDQGLLPLEAIVSQKLPVHLSDGQTFRRVYDWAKFENRETVFLRTRRGLEVEGSITHQLQMADGSWRRLDEVKIGDRLCLGAGLNQWATEYVQLDWQPRRRVTRQQVADQVGVDIETVIRYGRGTRGQYSEQLATPYAEYEAGLATMTAMQNKRQVINVPTVLNEKLAAVLGYLVGDGHISEVKRVIGLTTGDQEQADRFLELVAELFEITPRKKWDNGRWRINFYLRDANEFFHYLGLKTGRSARIKAVPELILRSPKSVVVAFLQAYYDCDGYAGKQGVILSTASSALAKTVQLLLLNFGILSRRRRLKDGCWHVHTTGRSAAVFQQEIGFGLRWKQEELEKYIQERQWYKDEVWEDEIVVLERRRADVYDISVETSHCYAAQGFINHNSYWHSTIMTQKVLEPNELIDYAEHNAGTLATSPGRLNPYKLGVELFRDIEDRWNRGAFGPEYEACGNMEARRQWDRQLGLGREKIFEVRRIYNDIGFIDAFLTEDFAREHKLFTFAFNEYTEQYEIASRHFEEIKRRLLFQLTNFGQPIIEIVDGNYNNRGELYLMHRYEGIEIDVPYAEDTLRNLFTVWGRPVHLETELEGEGRVLFSHNMNGSEHRII